mmetsp:Transcript_4094/g.8841  ORF Transcript_4094/g.8841 Transcript_4094/m.8841 type:complete len:94 (+) Transcript_4094:110-391(+)
MLVAAKMKRGVVGSWPMLAAILWILRMLAAILQMMAVAKMEREAVGSGRMLAAILWMLAAAKMERGAVGSWQMLATILQMLAAAKMERGGVGW